ncbi:MAG: hypothetical protein QXL01_07495 [Thermoplasmatales archaeon]
MNWNEFIEKLKIAKDEKKIMGNVASAFVNLIYSGALDSILPQGRQPSLQTYDLMYGEVKKALKSNAKKGKKRKNEFLGLDDVHHDIMLGLWRYQNNPIFQFNLRRHCIIKLESFGYTPLGDKKDIRGFMKQEKSATDGMIKETTFVTDEWQKFFERSDLRDLFVVNNGYRETLDGGTERFKLAILGAVIDKKISYTRTGKQRMTVTLFTGTERTGELTFWPSKHETNIKKSVLDDIKLSNVYLFIVNLREYQGNPCGNIQNIPLKNGTGYGYYKVFDFYADKNKEVGR